MPPGQGFGLLEQILKALTTTLERGLGDVHPVVMGYITLFLCFALAMLAYGILVNGRAIQGAVSLLVRGALVVWAVGHWPWFLEQLSELAIALGFLLTGSSLTVRELLDPGVMLKKAIDSAVPLWTAWQNNNSWWNPSAVMMGVMYFAIWAIYVGSFGVVVWRIFWIQTETLIATAAGVVLLPTLLFRPVQFVATGVLSYAANCFARYLIVAMLAGLLWTHFDTIPLQIAQAAPGKVNVTLQEGILSAAIAVVLAATFLGSNALASMLTSGVPSMGGMQHFGQVINGISGGISGLLATGGGAVTGTLGAARGALMTGQGMVGAARGLAAGDVHSLGEAARQMYSGAKAGISGGAQQRVAELMGHSASFTQRHGSSTLDRLMHQRNPVDRAHGGAHQR